MTAILEAKRKQLDLTQREAAKKVGISRQYYNALETGKRKPSVTVAKKLAETFGVDWTIFFT